MKQIYQPTYPCLVHNLPSSVYHDVDAMSASRLQALADGTPAHLSHTLANPSDSDDFVVGRALHSWVLERVNFDSEYAVAPVCDRRTTAGKATFAEFSASVGNRTVLTADQFDLVQAMARGIESHEDAHAYTSRIAGHAEVSAFAHIDGIATKSRFDRLINLDGDDVIVDVKTTRNRASRDEFERTIWQYGYGQQVNLYMRVAREVGLYPRHFLFVVVEKAAPHLTAVYRMSDGIVSMFDSRVDALIREYRNYMSNPSQGYVGVGEIGVPSWAVRRLETEIGEHSNV